MNDLGKRTAIGMASMLAGAMSIAQPALAGGDVESMLADFVEDYRHDGMARPLVFGIEVHDASTPRWHVVVGDTVEGESTPVELFEGFPQEPVVYFTTDLETLERIHSGTMASLTAMAKAFSTDFAPLDMEFMEGFAPSESTIPDMIAAAFHFWTRGTPEKVRFGDLALTREAHGASATLFYYQEGFRSGYFMIQPGQHANEDEQSKTNPFPTLIVVTRGSGQALIGGELTELRAGEAIFIGPGVTHEFWVDEGAKEGAEGVLLMFGDGA